MHPEDRPTDFDGVPKICGADIELANFILGKPRDVYQVHTCLEASRLLLRQVAGVPSRRSVGGYSQSSGEAGLGGASSDDVGGYRSQDWGRKYLENGGCAYIDLDHFEVCTPEVRSAYDYVAAWHALLRMADDARHDADHQLPPGQSVKVLATNDDGRGHSFGSHVSFLMSRRAWSNITQRKLHCTAFLAAHLASSIVITGKGKCGDRRGGGSNAPYQISCRADFIECLLGSQTTYHRPIVNTRDESHADDRRHARLHLIGFDNTLAQVATFLKIGATQIVLAMIEQDWIGHDVTLDDPVAAMRVWSHDPDLHAVAPLVDGRDRTAVEVQHAIYERAADFVSAGRAEGVVPNAVAILETWGRVLSQLAARDFGSLSRSLDWVLKRSLLERARSSLGVDWDSDEIRHLDQVYSSVDRSEGLFWACESSGQLETVVTLERIERAVHRPPRDTRAWTRAEVLRRVPTEEITEVDWNSVTVEDPSSPWGQEWRIDLSDPLAHGEAECSAALVDVTGAREVVQALGGSLRRPSEARFYGPAY